MITNFYDIFFYKLILSDCTRDVWDHIGKIIGDYQNFDFRGSAIEKWESTLANLFRVESEEWQVL